MASTLKRFVALAVCAFAVIGAFADDPVGFQNGKSMYSFGDWTLYWQANNNVVVYRDDGGLAAELIANSNGWWRVRYDNSEYVVWSAGGTSSQSFYEKPWDTINESPISVGNGASFQVEKSGYVTSYSIANNVLSATLSDGGRISFAKYGSSIDYLTKSGKTVTFVSSVKGRNVPVAWNEADTLYSFGAWYIFRAADDDVIAYRDGGDIALEFIEGTNGWFHLRYDASEYVVWSTGETEEQEFFDRPWEYASTNPIAITNGTSFTTGDREGQTTFLFEQDLITVSLSDGGVVSFYPEDYYIDFQTYDYDYYSYPYDIGVSNYDYDYDEWGYGGDDDYDEWGYDDYDEWGVEDNYYHELGLIGRRVRITDTGEIYSTINRSDCLSWPDEETKELGGQDAWDTFYPRVGDTGTVIWTSEHCDYDTIIALVLIDGYYVCIGVDGIETTSTSRGESPYIAYY